MITARGVDIGNTIGGASTSLASININQTRHIFPSNNCFLLTPDVRPSSLLLNWVKTCSASRLQIHYSLVYSLGYSSHSNLLLRSNVIPTNQTRPSLPVIASDREQRLLVPARAAVSINGCDAAILSATPSDRKS